MGTKPKVDTACQSPAVVIVLTTMPDKNKERRKATSCGALTYRVVGETIEVLLIKQFKSKDVWGVPKGHINDDETLEQCAVREVREETGITVKLGIKLQEVVSRYNGEEKTVHTWLAQQVGDDLPRSDDPDSEVADVRWFNIDSLPQLVRYQEPLISDAINVLQNVTKAKQRFIDALLLVHSYAGHVDEWITIKKELLKALPTEMQAAFSTRDPITKKQRPNRFERMLAEKWSELTGREVILTDE